jgi:KipI family sensor histidine kinase inhibitor
MTVDTVSARIVPFGDGAVLVELGEAVEIRLARRAQALAVAVTTLRASEPRLGAPVPGAASVLVPFDPLDLTPDDASDLLRPLLDPLPDDPERPAGTREIEIRVRYGGQAGPDLDAVAAETGLTPEEVVRLHAGTLYEVLFIGFAPGFAYLGEVPAEIAVPRLATPRTHVPAGSVGIAGRQTGVYPQASAGGWRILGHTEDRLFDPSAPDPVRLRAGDRVRFVPR